EVAHRLRIRPGERRRGHRRRLDVRHRLDLGRGLGGQRGEGEGGHHHEQRGQPGGRRQGCRQERKLRGTSRHGISGVRAAFSAPAGEGCNRRATTLPGRQGISAALPPVLSSMPTDSSVPPRRPARQGLFGGLVSSKQPRAATPPSAATKAPLKRHTVLNDAVELVKARKGRLLVGFLLMAVNRAAGLILPGTTKNLPDDVIGKHSRGMLMELVLVAGAATLLQAVTSFALSQVLGKAAQRSITEMRRAVQKRVARLPVGYFEQTKAGSLLSRVMNDAEGIRNLVGTGLVDAVGGVITAVLA